MAASRPISLLIVEDHEVVRLGLRTLLSRDAQLRIVGEAGTAAEALKKATELQPDVALLDIRLSGGEGISACANIVDECPNTRVLFLTSYADEDTVLAAILAGAQGYLLKEIGSEALLRSIKIVASGQSILDPLVTRRALDWMKGAAAPSGEGKLKSLSQQEQAVVALVAEGKTNKEIAVELGLSDKTVKNYLANIFQKLHITRRAQAAVFFAKQHSG